MALSNVSPGDPHAVAHNEERAAINDLETKSHLPTRPSDRAYFQILKALRSGTANIIAMGDSKTEGTGIPASTDRWLNKLQTHLRDLYGKTDTGYGYMPAKYATFYDFTDKPAITGTTSVPTSSNGLGTRSLKMELGSTVTFPARTFVSGAPLIVHWTRASGAGSIEVVTGSTVRATIDTAGTAASMRTNVTIPAGTHSVILRPKAGTAAVTVEGVTHQTSTSGIKVIDGSISGGTFRRFGDTATSSGHWEVVSSYSPDGIILAFGANDMSDRSPAQLVSDATNAVARATITAPDAGIIILLGTERTETAGQNKVREYEAALRAQFVNQANVSVLFESDLWLPKEGVDYTWGGPDGWLADTVHTSAFAHSEIARYLANELRPAVSGILEIPPTQWNDIQGKPSTFSPSAHAASHATGGADPITPESIGAPDNAQVSGSYYDLSGATTPFGPDKAESIGTAVNKVSSSLGIINAQLLSKADKTHAQNHYLNGSDPLDIVSLGGHPAFRGSYNGHADDQTTPGTYRLSASALNPTNGYPPGLAAGYLRVDGANNVSYMTQTLIADGDGSLFFFRTRVAGTWRAWTQLSVERDTGWRQTTAFLSAGFATDRARIRRVGQMVSVNLQGATVAGSHSYVVTGMPSGFRPSSSGVVFPVFEYLPAAATKNLGHFGLNSSGTTFFRTAAAGILYFECSYLTDDSWPTTLPGTPI